MQGVWTAIIHSREVWLQPIITVHSQLNKCTFIKSVDNSILLNRLHMAMITVLDIGSILCLESINENVQGLHSNRGW